MKRILSRVVMGLAGGMAVVSGCSLPDNFFAEGIQVTRDTAIGDIVSAIVALWLGN